MTKKLTKSKNDRKLAGVCGGIAEYMNIDVTVIRVLWVLAFFMMGTGLLAYIVCAIMMPEGEE